VISKKTKGLSLVFITLCTINVCFLSCTGGNTTTDINYQTYEITVDDVRLLWYNHPLFSFEYPEIFILIDANKDPHGKVHYDRSQVSFVYRKSDLPYRHLHVTIYDPFQWEWQNANDMAESIIDASELEGLVTTQKVMVAGIEADYLEYSRKPLGSEEQMIYRLAVFDYSDMIWVIYMDTYSAFPEPSYIQESFNHILATFKILDANCDKAVSSDELNITVKYDNEVFTITNNEGFSLCEVEVFLNYTNDDFSTGYHCDDIVGILPYDPNGILNSRAIQNRQLTDINGNEYIYYPGNEPYILLIQAEFPGCKNKKYSYIQTWE
jgi:hypothetical protein